jgi:hypothetical protein
MFPGIGEAFWHGKRPVIRYSRRHFNYYDHFVDITYMDMLYYISEDGLVYDSKTL